MTPTLSKWLHAGAVFGEQQAIHGDDPSSQAR